MIVYSMVTSNIIKNGDEAIHLHCNIDIRPLFYNNFIYG